MKSIKFLFVSFFLALPVFAAEATFAPEAAKPTPVVSAAVPATNKTDYKDAFLSFALEKAKSYSGAIEGAVTKAVDFAATEIPQVTTEFLRWHFWRATSYMIIGLLGCSVLSIASKMLYNLTKDKNVGIEVGVVCTIGSIAAALTIIPIFLSSVIPNVLIMIQISVAPRVYLIERVMAMAGKR